jgi:hypothetical protein
VRFAHHASGHHRPSLTLDTYVHLLDPDLPEPWFEAIGEGNTGATEATKPAETNRLRWSRLRL